MTVTHDKCRDALAADEHDPEVEAHLARCGRCRRFADALGRVDRLAASPELFTAPAGLADRIVEHASTAEVVDIASRTGARSVVRRAMLRTAAAAVIVALVIAAGLVATRDGTEDPNRMALINAARSVEDEGTAGVTVSGTVEFTVDREGQDPDFSSLPPEVQGYFEAWWNEVIAQFERQVAETLDRANQMLEHAFSRIGSGPEAPPSPPSPPPSPGEQREPAERDPATGGDDPSAPPERLSLGFSLEGAGVVDVDGRLHLDGTLRPVGGTVAAPGTEARFAVAVAGDARVVRGPDGQVVAIADSGPSVEAPLAELLARPGAIPSVLRAARDVEASGTVEVGGRQLRHYRFVADGRQAEVLLDADGKLQRLVVHDRGVGGQMAWRSSVSFDVTGYGVDASGVGDLAGSAQTHATPPSGSAAILYPFGGAVAEVLGGRR